MSILKFLFGIKEHPELHSVTPFKPSVSVLIPAYNEEATIESVIRSVRAQTYPTSEVIVVDDCSVDRTGEIARSLGATVVRTPKNTGSSSRAKNYGAQYISAPVFVTVDADTTLSPNAVELLLPALADPQTLSSCGFVIPSETRTFWERGRLVDYLYSLGLLKPAQEHWSVPLVSSGCFSAFNTDVFRKLGGFPEGNIAEDMALTWKAHTLGYKVRYVPEAVCYPKDPANWRQYHGQVSRWYRGFCQCVSESGFSLLQNPRLLAFVLLYLAMGLLSIPTLILSCYLAESILVSGWTETYSVLAAFLVLEAAITCETVLVNGYQRNKLRDALLGYPPFLIKNPIDSGIFLCGVLQEWVLRRKLLVWEKGH